jgi:hypothetical protein
VPVVTPSRDPATPQMLIELLCLSKPGVFESITSLQGRLALLETKEGHTSLWAAMQLLSTVLRDGVLCQTEESTGTPLDGWSERGELASLFGEFTITYGKDAKPRQKGQAGEWKTGDEGTIRLFPAQTGPKTKVLLPGKNSERQTIELSPHAYYLHTIGVSGVEEAIDEIVKALPKKQVQSKARRRSNTNQSQAVRDMLSLFKTHVQVIPETHIYGIARALKLIPASGAGSKPGKEAAAKLYAGVLFAGYNYDNPQERHKRKRAAEKEGEEGEEGEDAGEEDEEGQAVPFQ